MISLFNINHHLHTYVSEFEEMFADYVGAKYAVSLSSETMAIFLLFRNRNLTIKIPSILPPVVANALLLGGNKIEFIDDVNWVGSSYVLYDVIDSAHRVDRNQFNGTTALFSHYPTKPVGSVDGGTVVSDDKEFISELRELINNGMLSGSSWEVEPKCVGWKAYMNSQQAKIAIDNLKMLDEKKEKLQHIRDIYNGFFGLHNKSDHLYRILIQSMNNVTVLNKLKENNIIAGIHYRPLHLMSIYKKFVSLPKSENIGNHTISLPFHYMLSDTDINYVCQTVSRICGW